MKITLQKTESNYQLSVLMCLNIIPMQVRITVEKEIKQTRNISFAANFIRNILLIINNRMRASQGPPLFVKEKQKRKYLALFFLLDCVVLTERVKNYTMH